MEPRNISAKYADEDISAQWPIVKPMVNGVLGTYGVTLFLQWLRHSKESERRDAQHLETLREIRRGRVSTPVQLRFSDQIHQDITPVSPGPNTDVARLEAEIARMRSQYENHIKSIQKDIDEDAKALTALQKEKIDRILEHQAHVDELEQAALKLKNEFEVSKAQTLQIEQKYKAIRDEEKASAAGKITLLQARHKAEITEREEAAKEAAQKDAAIRVLSAHEHAFKECEQDFNIKLIETTNSLEQQHMVALHKAEEDAGKAKAALKQETDALTTTDSSCVKLEKQLADAQVHSAQLKVGNEFHETTMTEKYNALKLADSQYLSLKQHLSAANGREAILKSQLTKAQEELEAYDHQLADKDEEVKKTREALKVENSRRLEADKTRSSSMFAAEKTTATLEDVRQKLQLSLQREKLLESTLLDRDLQAKSTLEDWRKEKGILSQATLELQSTRGELEETKKVKIAQKQEIARLVEQLEDARKFKADFASAPPPRGPAFGPHKAPTSAIQQPEETIAAAPKGVENSKQVATKDPVSVEATAEKSSETLAHARASAITEPAPVRPSPYTARETPEAIAQPKTTGMRTSKWADYDDDEPWSPKAAVEELKSKPASQKASGTEIPPAGGKLKASAPAFAPATAESVGQVAAQAVPEAPKPVIKQASQQQPQQMPEDGNTRVPQRSAKEKEDFKELMRTYHFTPETAFVSPETLEYAKRYGVDPIGEAAADVEAAPVPQRSEEVKKAYRDMMAGFGWDTKIDEVLPATSAPQKAVTSDQKPNKKTITQTQANNVNPTTAAVSVPLPSSSPAASGPAPFPNYLPSNAPEWDAPARPSDLQNYKVCHNCGVSFYHPSAAHDPENHLRYRAIFRKHIGPCKLQFRTCENEGCGKVMRNDWFYGTHQKKCSQAKLAQGLKLHDPKALREKQIGRDEENKRKEEARREVKRLIDEQAGTANVAVVAPIATTSSVTGSSTVAPATQAAAISSTPTTPTMIFGRGFAEASATLEPTPPKKPGAISGPAPKLPSAAPASSTPETSRSANKGLYASNYATEPPKSSKTTPTPATSPATETVSTIAPEPATTPTRSAA